MLDLFLHILRTQFRCFAILWRAWTTRLYYPTPPPHPPNMT